jgi:hypothetical protein
MKCSFFAAVAVSAVALVTGCAANRDEAPQDETQGKLEGFGIPALAVVLNGADADHLIDALADSGVDVIHGFTGDIVAVNKIDCFRYYNGTAEDYTYKCSIDARGGLVGTGTNNQPELHGADAKALIDLLEQKAGVRPEREMIYCITAPCPVSNTFVWSTGKVGCSSSFLEGKTSSCSVTVDNATPPHPGDDIQHCDALIPECGYQGSGLPE